MLLALTAFTCDGLMDFADMRLPDAVRDEPPVPLGVEDLRPRYAREANDATHSFCAIET